MANPSKNDTQWPPKAEIATAEEDKTLNLGHGGLKSECWCRARGRDSETRSNMGSAQRATASSLRHPASGRTRCCPRPSPPADARITATDIQYLSEG